MEVAAPSTTEIEQLCDGLVDFAAVEAHRERLMNESFTAYTDAVLLLGYFSKLKDYKSEYDALLQKIFACRHEFTNQYKSATSYEAIAALKAILTPPTATKWFESGVKKYDKVRNYSIYFYRKQLTETLAATRIDVGEVAGLLDAIVFLDRYYDIYDDTLGFFMKTNDRFRRLVQKRFPEHIHL